MHGDEKNLRDSDSQLNISLKDTPSLFSLSKTNKLVTALYMVTDIMDSEEPLRLKLRTLGVEILSDSITPKRTNFINNIEGILSFLGLAFTMNMISEMNKNILVNEFTKLKNSLIVPQDNPAWLEEFLREEEFSPRLETEGRERRSLGSTHLGVQKGSTLLKALKDNLSGVRRPTGRKTQDFNGLKKQRRESIINIIKTNAGSATIKDIQAKIVRGSALYGESSKTLQRELASMVKDSVLKKKGSKRWTQYFLKN
ncbi:MAG: hypothetical protein WD963_01090 [Candidatus Paceibacterota bacterium]